MATLQELVNSLNNTSADARAVLQKIREIWELNADVTVTFADGTQVTHPSLPKMQGEFESWKETWRAEADVCKLPIKYIYVDAANGSDINDGTSASPVATLSRAIALCQQSKFNIIYLPYDQTFYVDENLFLSGAIVFQASGTGTNKPKIQILYSESGGSYYYYYILMLGGCTIYFLNVDVEVVPYTGAGSAGNNKIFLHNYGSMGKVSFNGCNITLPANPDPVHLIAPWLLGFIATNFYNCAISSPTGATNYVMFLGAGALYVTNTTITDTDWVLGLVKDATYGFYRNLITNLTTL